jgi:hypothetical protein
VDAIEGDGFGWMPAVIRRLVNVGHEVAILVTNARPALEAWAREQVSRLIPPVRAPGRGIH